MLSRYPAYIVTGTHWLEKIPSHWKLVGLKKYLDSLIDYCGKTPEKTKDGIFLVTAKNIKNGRVDYSLSQEFVDPIEYEEIMHRGKPHLGEVLFTTEAPLGEVANIDNINVALAQRVIKISGKKNVLNNYFLKYWLENKNFQDHLQSLATGSTALGIKSSKLFELRTLLPSYEEQQTIAKFLDYKTTQIDELIEKKEQLLKLLEEKRIALITNAVTGKVIPPGGGHRTGSCGPVGDNGVVSGYSSSNEISYKPSGIPWLGNIPQHWEVKRLRSLMKGKLSNGIFKKRDDWGFGTKLINVSDIYTNNFLVNTSNLTLVNCSDEELETYRVKDGDFFFVRSSLKLEGIGQSSSLIGNNEELVFECHLVKGSPNQSQINARFLNYFLNSTALRNYFISHANTVTMSTIDQSVFKDTILCVPTLLEQQYIVEHLDIELAKIDQLSAKVTEAIEKLKEYRTSLITSAVTGKIDLRNWSPPTSLSLPRACPDSSGRGKEGEVERS